jgi:4-hydroxybenzoyl-CoA thioesterase
MTAFHWQRKIRFRDCDPAGIVFYPRYFEMMNDLVETFLDDAIGWSFARLHLEEGLGVPMGTISARFEAPSRLGDVLTWTLAISRMGRSTADLVMVAVGDDGRQRLRAEGTLVCVNLEAMKSRRWPDEIRARLAAYLEEKEP